MSSLNDFATTYMCQSLPFGGVKHSGFDRFAGIEGLRGMCIPKVRLCVSSSCAYGRLVAARAGEGWACTEQWEGPHGSGRQPTGWARLGCMLPLCAACGIIACALRCGLLQRSVPKRKHSLANGAPLPRCTLPLLQAVAEDRWPFKTAIPPLLQASAAASLARSTAQLHAVLGAQRGVAAWGLGRNQCMAAASQAGPRAPAGRTKPISVSGMRVQASGQCPWGPQPRCLSPRRRPPPVPPLPQYPVSDKAFSFVSSLVWMFYAPGWAGRLRGGMRWLACGGPLACRGPSACGRGAAAAAGPAPACTAWQGAAAGAHALQLGSTALSLCPSAPPARQPQGPGRPHCLLPARRRPQGNGRQRQEDAVSSEQLTVLASGAAV